MTTELVYREIPCQKSVSGDDFTRGNQDYNFSMGAPTCWIPSRTYFRATMRLTATNLAGAIIQPTTSSQIAFADNVVGGLYNNQYFKMGGQDVSSIVSFIPQAAALLQRTSKSGAWLNSIGKSCYMNNADFQERVAITASDDLLNVSSQQEYAACGGQDGVGVVSFTSVDGIVNFGVGSDPAVLASLAVGDRLVIGGLPFTITVAGGTGVMRVNPTFATGGVVAGVVYGLRMRRRDGGSRNLINVEFQLPIGIFQHNEPLGSGEYRFSLNPNADYKKACVESSRIVGLTPGVDYDFTIIDMKLYVATVKSSIPKAITNLVLVEMQVQSKPASKSRTYEFTVPSSTLSLAIFVQAGVAGSDTRSSPSQFKCLDGSQNLLKSLQITYANMTKPSTRWDSEFGPGVNRFQQRYLDDLIETRLIESDGGAETFGEWLQRGPYYFYGFNRDRDDKSTQVQISTEFSFLEPDAQFFLVAMYTRVTEIATDGGLIQSVRSLNI